MVIENKHSNCFSISADQAQPLTVTRSVNLNQTITNSYDEIDFLFVFGADSKEDISSYNYLNYLKNEYDNLNVNTTFIDNATVSDYKNLDDFELIYIMSHGSYNNSTPFICTKEIATEEKKKDYKKDYNSNNLTVVTKGGQDYFWILPSFFEDNYKNQELNNSIVLLSPCCAFGDKNCENYMFATSLKKAGAGAVIGFCNSVDQSYSNCFYEKLIYLLSQGNTVIESFNQSKNIIGENEKIFFNSFSNSTYQKDYVPYPLISIDKSIKLFDNPLEGFGTFAVTVKDEQSNSAIENVGVAIYNVDKSELLHLEKTNSNGVVSLDLPEGKYTCQFSHDYYENSTSIGFTIEKNVTTVILNPVYLTRKTASVSGIVKDKETNEAISGVNIEIVDNESGSLEPITTVTTNENGVFSVELPYGDYSFSFHHDDYEYYGTSQTVDVDYVSFGEILLYSKESSTGGDNSTGGEDEERTVTDSGTCGDNLTWTLYDDGELVISGTGDMPNWTHSSSAPWDSYQADITSVNIGNNVTSIGNHAFSYCDSLTDVTISGSVTTIGDEAFYYCDSLTNITIPDSVTTIGAWTFGNCHSLTSVIIPDSVTTIGAWVFYFCKSLVNVTIPKSVTTIGGCAFEYCHSLTSIVVDRDNKYYTSDNCGVLFNKSKTNLIQYPVGNTRTDYTIPDSVTTINANSFENCHSLTNITIPDSVTTINDSTFYNCDGLTSVKISNSVITIGYDAFYHCDNLTSITIPNSVTTIGMGAFGSCNSLANVTIGKSVTIIGYSAFSDCDSLTNIIIPDSVTTIADYAFWGCGNLTTVLIGNSVTVIGESAFQCCSKLISITIPKSATTIEAEAFDKCENLSNVYYSGTTEDWNNISIGNSNYYLINATIHYNR